MSSRRASQQSEHFEKDHRYNTGQYICSHQHDVQHINSKFMYGLCCDDQSPQTRTDLLHNHTVPEYPLYVFKPMQLDNRKHDLTADFGSFK